MKKMKWIMMAALMVMLSWASGALAENFIKIGNFNANILNTQINMYQGGPLDSVLVIKGKIDMGQMNYYSVTPVFGEDVVIDNKSLSTLAQELGLNKIEFVPQFKSSEAAGWALYLYFQTGNDPTKWQKFKAISNVKMTSLGGVRVKTQQNGSQTGVPATPGIGTVMTKTIGPVQPK